MDDDRPVDATIRPVLPSRAGAESVPARSSWCRAFLSNPSPGTVSPAKARKTRHRKAERLPEPEIKRITRNRSKNLKNTKRSAAATKAWKTRRHNEKVHHGGKFTPEVYKLIGTLMGMDKSTRNLIITLITTLDR